MAPPFSRILERWLGRDARSPANPRPAKAREHAETEFHLLKAGTGDGNFPVLYRRLSRRGDAPEDAPRRAEAYALLRDILSNASGRGLCRLDALCRGPASPERREWRREGAGFPADGFCPDGTGAREKIWGYAIASFHPDGFLREKAVMGLASIGSGEELPFLLLRLRDGVDQVRARAETAVEARLQSAPGAPDSRWVRALPILQRLRTAGRSRGAATIGCAAERIERFIASDAKALLSGLASPDAETRRYAFALASGASGSPAIDLETLQEHVLGEPRGEARLHALRCLENRLPFPWAGAFIGRLLRDPYPPVRRLALDIRCGRSPKDCGEVLREMALSMNAGVRRAARLHMQAAAREEPAALYRKALSEGNGKALVGALRGLGEVGERQDAERIHPFLKHGRAMVARAAIRSLASLQASFLATLLAPLVMDARPRVSREAVLALKTRTAGLNPEKLNAARKASSLPHVRKHVLLLLFAIGHWESLPYILEALSEAERPGEGAEAKTEERRMAEKALARWILRSRSHFSEPGKALKERGADALARFGAVLDGKTRKTLEAILR